MIRFRVHMRGRHRRLRPLPDRHWAQHVHDCVTMEQFLVPPDVDVVGRIRPVPRIVVGVGHKKTLLRQWPGRPVESSAVSHTAFRHGRGRSETAFKRTTGRRYVAHARGIIDPPGWINHGHCPFRWGVMAACDDHQLLAAGNGTWLTHRLGIVEVGFEQSVVHRSFRMDCPQRMWPLPKSFLIIPSHIPDQSVVQAMRVPVHVLVVRQSFNALAVRRHTEEVGKAEVTVSQRGGPALRSAASTVG